MVSESFSEIARRYKETSIIQKSAADILFALLKIQPAENVLDIGCGTGNLTRKIYEISGGTVVGIDPAAGMISESKKVFGKDIEFLVRSAEEIDFVNQFDVIFCNSAFQWIKNIDKAISNFHRSLKKGGRIGIQAPARKNYSPNFIEAIETVKKNPYCARYMQDFISPWSLLETARDYASCFTRHSFKVAFSKIQTISTFHSPEETYEIFASGATAGYLNKDNYKYGFDQRYWEEFQQVVKESFQKQAIHEGKVNLAFNRIYLIAVKV